MDHQPFATALSTAKSNLELRLQRLVRGRDPQQGTPAQQADAREYRRIADWQFGQEDTRHQRDRLCFNYCLCSAGRGDDVRALYLADVMSPVLLPAIGALAGLWVEFFASHSLPWLPEASLTRCQTAQAKRQLG